jgi:hypothetical protein
MWERERMMAEIERGVNKIAERERGK